VEDRLRRNRGEEPNTAGTCECMYVSLRVGLCVCVCVNGDTCGRPHLHEQHCVEDVHVGSQGDKGSLASRVLLPELQQSLTLSLW
jgi:hypothetical protein